MSAVATLAGLPLESAIKAALYAIRMHESGGSYTLLNLAFNPPAGDVVRHPNGRTYTRRVGRPVTTASGAYQFTKGTWAGYRGRVGAAAYAYAFQAPPEAQDAAARLFLLDRWNNPAYRQDWDRVLLGHFNPAGALMDKARWSTFRPTGPNNPTLSGYLSLVTKHLPAGVQLAQAGPGGAPPARGFPVALAGGGGSTAARVETRPVTVKSAGATVSSGGVGRAPGFWGWLQSILAPQVRRF